MNKKIIIKIILDIIMIILFIIELNLNVTGLDLHEVIGLFAGLTLIINLILNSKWIKMIFNNKSKNKKIKTSVILNAILLISFLIMIITGILISKFIFSFNIKHYMLIRNIHKISAYMSGGIILIHLLMHFNI